MIALNAGK
ncbi:hypothetical protein MXB_145 [Myxobolus squamalis]|nr:hypothetical protein MXB_145 [Myxobolus squamalis]